MLETRKMEYTASLPALLSAFLPPNLTVCLPAVLHPASFIRVSLVKWISINNIEMSLCFPSNRYYFPFYQNVAIVNT